MDITLANFKTLVGRGRNGEVSHNLIVSIPEGQETRKQYYKNHRNISMHKTDYKLAKAAQCHVINTHTLV